MTDTNSTYVFILKTPASVLAGLVPPTQSRIQGEGVEDRRQRRILAARAGSRRSVYCNTRNGSRVLKTQRSTTLSLTRNQRAIHTDFA